MGDARSLITIHFRRGLTQQAGSADVLESLHPDDLKDVDSVVVAVEPTDATSMSAYERGVPADERVGTRARLLLDRSSGMRLEVAGASRTRVEGLSSQLTEILGRGRGARYEVAAWGAGWVLVGTGLFLGPFIAQWLGYADEDDKLTLGEIVGMVLGGAVPLSLVAGYLWLFPALEILAEADRSRYRRFRSFLYVALVLPVFALAIPFVWRVLT